MQRTDQKTCLPFITNFQRKHNAGVFRLAEGNESVSAEERNRKENGAEEKEEEI
jgi:hypothetical protein